MATAARKLGCARQTVFRRLQDPDFRRAVAQARGQIAARTTSMLARTSTLAVRTLRKLLEDGTADVIELVRFSSSILMPGIEERVAVARRRPPRSAC